MTEMARTSPEFQSTSPVWRTTDGKPSRATLDAIFQSTSPVWRTTILQPRDISRRANFNPRPPCGGRPSTTTDTTKMSRFQSTSPVWRTTPNSIKYGTHFTFQSTSPVWRTTLRNIGFSDCDFISIHVPRVEDDDINDLGFVLTDISIHVPRVEDDTPQHRLFGLRFYFNPRPPCGGRRH